MYPSPYTTVVTYNNHSFYLTALGTSGVFAPLPDVRRKYPNVQYSIEQRDVLTKRSKATVGRTLWLVRKTSLRPARGLPLMFFYEELLKGVAVDEEAIEYHIKRYGCRLPNLTDKTKTHGIFQGLKARFS